MRLFLNNTPTVKQLTLAYAKDSITISGRIAATVQKVDHEHEVLARDLPEIKEGDVVDHAAPPPHSFDPVILPGRTTQEAVDAEDVQFSQTISFADLKALPGFACYSQLAFGVQFINGEVTLHETYSRSKATRKRETSMDKNHFYVLHITVPCAKVQSFDDCLVIATCDASAFGCDEEYRIFTTQAEFKAVVPTLTVDGPDVITQAGGKLTVLYAWPDGTPIVGAEVYAEPTAGYVNRQRVHTDRWGKAYFTVLPLALDKGEGFRVKFGFKHFSGKTEKVLSVS
jgi:hypothetical protein